jgi:hypothetical protein
MDNNSLLREIAYSLPFSNKIVFDYTAFKRYATPIHYTPIVNYMLETIRCVLMHHSTFEIHVNLFSFNTSSLVKYKDFIRIFSEHSTHFNDKLTHFYVYHTPSVMDSLLKTISSCLFRRDNASNHPEIIMYSKKDSEHSLHNLHYKPTKTHHSSSSV